MSLGFREISAETPLTWPLLRGQSKCSCSVMRAGKLCFQPFLLQIHVQKLGTTISYIALVSLFLPFVCHDSEQRCSLVTCVSALTNGWCQITFIDHILQVVKAFVVLSPTFSSSDLESLTRDLQEHVKKTTAPYKYPRKVNASEERL